MTTTTTAAPTITSTTNNFLLHPTGEIVPEAIYSRPTNMDQSVPPNIIATPTPKDTRRPKPAKTTTTNSIDEFPTSKVSETLVQPTSNESNPYFSNNPNTTNRLSRVRKLLESLIEEDEADAPQFTIGHSNDTPIDGRGSSQKQQMVVAFHNRSTINDVLRPIILDFHEQFKQEFQIEHENTLAREIRQLYCQVSKLKRLQAVTLAQTNGILAASALGLPLCSRLHGIGMSLLIQTCEKKQIVVTAKETKCGFQPFVVHNNKNYTIGTDGWSIHPYSKCFWKSNLVNLNGKTYHWEHNNTTNGEWIEQTPTIHTPNLNLIASFEELPLNDYDYALKGHPAHSNADMERLNVLNEIIGRIEETHDNSLSGLVMSEKQENRFGEMFSWTDYLKMIVFATIGFILLVLSLYIFARVNPIPALVNSFRQRRQRRQTTSDYNEVPMENMLPMLGAPNQPVIIPGNAYPFIIQPSAPLGSMSNFINRIHLSNY